jgi:predicted O-linked N-acetylglucosamine transferase (SPINDLY family)
LRSIEKAGDYFEALHDLGVAYAKMGFLEKAMDAYERALHLKRDSPELLFNLGCLFDEKKNPTIAIQYYENTTELDPNFAEAWRNKGLSLCDLKRYKEAIISFEIAYKLQPNYFLLYGDICFLNLRLCNWIGINESKQHIFNLLKTANLLLSPSSLLALVDNSLIHYDVASNYTQKKHPPSNQVIGTPVNRNQNKIRIGYFSPDFKDHPVAALTVELFELHNRDQFEIIAFSFCGYSDSVLGLRLQEAFDQFIDVSSMSDIEIAQLSANLGIDIAVDLCGHTAQSRTGIFAHRAAPIQVNYLGYPGTMGAPYLDYIIADKTLIPRESFNFYSEKIVYLPHTYQVNDRSRTISDRRFTKQELGLPETGFIFCCFNNNFKILPEMFNSWMRILLSVEKSTLWLFEDNPWAADNLKKEAAKRGVAPERLIFAQKLPRAEHLARHLYADLFLDTYPYNAHTTASDALWAGLPVLTLMGNSFASRVAASLLNAINLPELITTNQADYESLAINLATHPQKLNTLKQKLINDRLTSPLFNTALFTENIEKVYLQMHKRYQSKFKPDHMLNEW